MHVSGSIQYYAQFSYFLQAPYVLPDARWGVRFQDGKMVRCFLDHFHPNTQKLTHLTPLRTQLDSIVHALHAGSAFVKYPADGPVEWARNKPYIMGLTAEFLAEKYKITREEQDAVPNATNPNSLKSKPLETNLPHM